MKRWLKYGFLPGAALVLLLFGFVGWILGSTAGFRFLEAAFSRFTPLKVEATQVEGALAGRLNLGEVRVRWPGGSASARSLEWNWHPWALVSGRLEFPLVAASGIIVQLPEQEGDGGPASWSFHWPRASGWRLWIDGRLERLEVKALEVRRGEELLFTLERAAGKLLWQEGRLSLEQLDAVSDLGRLQGRAVVGFGRPSLESNLTYRPPKESGFELLELKTSLVPVAGRTDAAGPVEVTLGWPEETMTLEGTLLAAPDRLELENAGLTRADGSGRLSGDLTLLFQKEALRAETRLDLKDLDLDPELSFPTLISGQLEAKGWLDGYQGNLDLKNEGEGWHQARLRTDFSGDQGHLELTRLSVSWLAGELQGDLALFWQDGFSLDARLSGAGFDPGVIDARWRGKIDLEGEGHLFHSVKDGWQGQVALELPLLRLRDHQASGRAGIIFGGKNLTVEELRLEGEGLSLTASGALDDRVAFDLRVDQVGAWVPDLEGRIASSGWVARPGKEWQGALRIAAEKLAYGYITLQSLDLDAAAQGLMGPYRLHLAMKEGMYREVVIRRVSAEGSGTLDDHRLLMEGTAEKGKAAVAIAGGYREGSWRGAVERLEGNWRGFGAWRLLQPAGIAVSGKRLEVENSRLASDAGEKIALSIGLAFEPLAGRAKLAWDDLRLSRANPWLSGWKLDGSTSGSGSFQVDPGTPSTIELTVEAAGVASRESFRLQVASTRLDGSWSAAGLDADWQVKLLDGEVNLRVESPQPSGWKAPGTGTFTVGWQELDLQGLRGLVPGLGFPGAMPFQGNLEGEWGPEAQLSLHGHTELQGEMLWRNHFVHLEKVTGDLRWNDEGLDGNLGVTLAPEGELSLSLRSPQKGRLSLPDVGEIRADWRQIDLKLLSFWLPPEMTATGRLEGSVEGRLEEKGGLTLEGGIRTREGVLAWREGDGEFSAGLETAEVHWNWKGDDLTGELEMKLEEFGALNGSFRVPLPARLPVRMRGDGAIRGRLAGELRELGLVSAIFPGAVQESQGKVRLDLAASGTWQTPEVSGTVDLKEAGAYLPQAGIQLENVELTARLGGDRIRVTRFGVTSGQGRLEGTADFALEGWRLQSYRVALKGEDFQLIRLPEIRVKASPDLAFEGTPAKLTGGGVVRLPEARITGLLSPAPVTPSEDVVIVDHRQPEEGKAPFLIDVRVKVVLGDHVLVRVKGVDARLEGSVAIQVLGADQVTAQGEIRVAEGSYSAYGVRLKIEEGKVLWAGGPLDGPTLDVLALRTVGEIKAGIRLSGPLKSPTAEPYSEPSMPDTDVISYIVLGRPLEGGSSDNAGLLMLAANNLLSKGESTMFQDRLERLFGLDVVNVEQGRTEEEGSRITLGKYLSPDLYVAYGQSLTSRTNEVRLRYDLFKNWQIESSVSQESSIDLFYKISFH